MSRELKYRFRIHGHTERDPRVREEMSNTGHSFSECKYEDIDMVIIATQKDVDRILLAFSMAGDGGVRSEKIEYVKF